jgi:hypothetical protein
LESLLLLVAFVLGYLVSLIQWYQPEKGKVLKLSIQLKWAESKIRAQQLDLDRWAEKNRLWASGKVDQLMGKASGQDLPQQNLSYWKFEGPKLQARVLELEMQLEQLRSRTLWKDH